MKCVCPKCGRKNDVSADELRLQKGTVVCPRCLTTYKVDIPKKNAEETPPPIPAKRASSSTATASKPRKITPATTPARFCNNCGATVPAGHATCPECGHRVPLTNTSQRRIISFTEGGSSSTSRGGSSALTHPYTDPLPKPAKPSKPNKTKTKAKSKNNDADTGLSWLKTVGYTIMIVAIFYIFYFLLGVIFN